MKWIRSETEIERDERKRVKTSKKEKKILEGGQCEERLTGYREEMAER